MSRIARSNASPASIQRSASCGDSVSRDCHAPLAGLQREHAPVGRVVVDDEHALARELGLRADEIARPGWPAASAVGAWIVKKNVDPLPGPSLVAHMRPPISSARRLLIARPRPVPPYLRVVDESACENDWNSRPMPSADRPMPVSRTANVSSTCRRPRAPRSP